MVQAPYTSTNMKLELDSAEIHVWCAFFDEITGDALLRRYRSLLSEAERHRLSRFVFARDRHRYLVTRALVRTVLSRYADVAPAELTFICNSSGRPEIANDTRRARDISFNISHTNSLIVVAAARRRALGVDTENAAAGQPPVEIAERFFAEDEVAALHALPKQEQQRRFFEYWTLKESYIKARSMGLSIPLHTVSFRFVGNKQVTMSICTDQVDSASRWRFWQFSIVGDYVTAVCAERLSTGLPQLVLKRIVPLGSEDDLAIDDLRTSD